MTDHEVLSWDLFGRAARELAADVVADGFAPVLILALSDKGAYLERYAEPDKGWTARDESAWPIPYWDVDTGMAAGIDPLRLVADGGMKVCRRPLHVEQQRLHRRVLRAGQRP